MTSKERLLTALNKGKPDRVPATLHQWQPYHLKKYMKGLSDLEAFHTVGLDASISHYITKQKTSPDWQVSSRRHVEGNSTIEETEIRTPGGVLTQKTAANDITTYTLEPLIKNDDDIYLIQKYRPLFFYDKAEVSKAYDHTGDDGILRGFLCGGQGGCWQDACTLYGTEEMIFAIYDKPDWVHEFLGILLGEKLRFINESLKGARFDLIETGGGASSNNVISPSIHKEFCLPYDRKLHDALRGIGHMSTYHTCGGMTKILDLILLNGCDASETLSPVGVGGDITDPGEVFSRFSGNIAMIGGLDQFNILTSGTPQDIASEVSSLFHAYGKDGAYIMSASDHFFDAPPENLIAFANAAKECKY